MADASEEGKKTNQGVEDAPSSLAQTTHDSPAPHEATRPAASPSLAYQAGKRMGALHKASGLGVTFLIIGALTAGFFGGVYGASIRNNNSESITSQPTKVVMSSEGQVLNSIAKNVGQSVVSVNVTGQSTSQSIFGFGIPSQEQSAGTGIILTKDGLIVTNRHVVPVGTTDVSVTLSDGTTFTNVKVVGRTSQSDSLDVAFLKISDTKGKKLVPASIGDSSKVKVGDAVVAIGNALGQFQNTVTSGIISGYGRSVRASSSTGTSSENLEGLFQTDAAINEGNSGGPLVNLSGQVIGINTAIAGNAQNIGFAIPINDVSGLIKSVESTGKFERPYLGVIYVPLTSDTAKQYALNVDRGAYIPPEALVGQNPIVSGSPAEKAGLRAGDIITKVDGTSIDENTSLTSLLDKHAVGDKVTLTVNRQGKTTSISVKLGAVPQS